MLRLALAFCLAVMPAIAQADDPPEGPRKVELGEYMIRLPEGEGPFPAVLHLHGWGASAKAVMSNRGMVDAFLGRGYALVAPQGLPRSGRPQNNWTVRDGLSDMRDEAAFFEQVLADAAAEGWIDRDRVLMTGFSRGGSMVWDIACHDPGIATAYAPISGAFWEPMPERCAAPVDLFHTHGWSDRVVPLEGRVLANGALVQGDVFESLFILREANRVTQRLPDDGQTGTEADTGYLHRAWTGETGARIDLLIHPGGHGAPAGWAGRAIAWFEDRLAARAEGGEQ